MNAQIRGKNEQKPPEIKLRLFVLYLIICTLLKTKIILLLKAYNFLFVWFGDKIKQVH